jgi:replication-associated recombination protein RarA
MKSEAPLTTRMRLRTLDENIGQEHILDPGKLLRRAIFWRFSHAYKYTRTD